MKMTTYLWKRRAFKASGERKRERCGKNDLRRWKLYKKAYYNKPCYSFHDYFSDIKWSRQTVVNPFIATLKKHISDNMTNEEVARCLFELILAPNLKSATFINKTFFRTYSQQWQLNKWLRANANGCFSYCGFWINLDHQFCSPTRFIFGFDLFFRHE